jgi:hypothetical protein
LAQESNVVRLFQLLHVPGIVAVLAVVELEGADVLVGAMDRFHLALAPQVSRHLDRRDRERECNKEDEKDRA